jgi:hypothetical protein
MIKKEILEKYYTVDKLSMMEISNVLGCSQNKIVYWMQKHGIARRSISDAIYQQHNPNGDPFVVRAIDSIEKAQLYGLGIGLYWGEGTKANKYAVRLGNTDAALLGTFIHFLIELFAVERKDMRFQLQIFTDIDVEAALKYWTTELSVDRSQFYKVHITISGSIGTYKKKCKYGVVTVYYHNKKLRDILVGMLPR